MTSPSNPLTARVFVNRLWQHHFGRGIVATSNDFGQFGDRPSHPELLDWLANDFVKGGWKIKRMHKLICMSATSTDVWRERLSQDSQRGSGRSVDPWKWLAGVEARGFQSAIDLCPREAFLEASDFVDVRSGGYRFELPNPLRDNSSDPGSESVQWPVHSGDGHSICKSNAERGASGRIGKGASGDPIDNGPNTFES